MISFTVYGTPAPAGSKRAFRGKGASAGRILLTDASKRSKPWQALIRQVAGEAMAGRELLRCPLDVVLRFYVRRPKGHYGTGRNAGKLRGSAPPYPASKPDVLKLARAVEDALTGIVYADDALIVREVLYKRYGEQERVEVGVAMAMPEGRG